MKANCLRGDVFDIMMWQISCATCDGLTGLTPENTPVRNSLQSKGFELMQEPAIIDLAKHSYVIQPLANTFTLGIYGLVAPAKAAVPPSGAAADAVSTDQSQAEATPQETVPETVQAK